jgi:hypothetical protein
MGKRANQPNKALKILGFVPQTPLNTVRLVIFRPGDPPNRPFTAPANAVPP